MTPISFARISFAERMASTDPALIIFWSWATRNWLEKTENCTAKRLRSSCVASPFRNHLV